MLSVDIELEWILSMITSETILLCLNLHKLLKFCIITLKIDQWTILKFITDTTMKVNYKILLFKLIIF